MAAIMASSLNGVRSLRGRAEHTGVMGVTFSSHRDPNAIFEIH